MTLPAYVGVIGAGRMGAGIAHAFLAAGVQVTVVESTIDLAQAGADRVRDSLRRASERGTLAEPAEVVERRLTVTHDAVALESCLLVIEAVPEDIELKLRVLGLAERAAPDAVLATNTSSLSIDALAARLIHPERLVGLHFFNPVPVSELLEVIVGTSTGPELRERAQSWAAALGKTAITVTDSPGFASSRLGVCIALEAMRMLEAGVASAEDIDTAMTLGYKHPMGPLRTTDVVGLDVRLAIAEHLHRELGERFAPPAILQHKVESGHLGRKSGQGFYSW